MISTSDCNTTYQVILILAVDSSYNNLEALKFAKTNGLILLCLPAHCTHRMQPLDVSYFGSLKILQPRITWAKEASWAVGLDHVLGIFGRAYGKTATVENITNRFEKSGIWTQIFSRIISLYPVTKNVVKMTENARRNMTNNFLDLLRRTQTLVGLVQRDFQVITGSSTIQKILNGTPPITGFNNFNIFPLKCRS